MTYSCSFPRLICFLILFDNVDNIVLQLSLGVNNDWFICSVFKVGGGRDSGKVVVLSNSYSIAIL